MDTLKSQQMLKSVRRVRCVRGNKMIHEFDFRFEIHGYLQIVKW